MDSIDITDVDFSLEMPRMNTEGPTSDYTVFIYIGAAILAVFIGMFVYKLYMNKQKSQPLDCDGGFCSTRPTDQE